MPASRLPAPGDDTVTLTAGPDFVAAGNGADTLHLFDDGAIDHVRCGNGADQVIYHGPVDPLDTMHETCESVTSTG